MNDKSKKNLLIKAVFEEDINVYERNLERYHYKFANRFWSLVLLIYEKDKKIFNARFWEIMDLYSQLFFDTLTFKQKCLEKFNFMDRDDINRHMRGNYEPILKYQDDLAKIASRLSEFIVEKTFDLKKSKNSLELNLKFDSTPQPYLPTCGQITRRLARVCNFKLSNDKIIWPYEKLTKSELKKLQNFGKNLFPHIILHDVSGEMKTFDESGKMAFSAFRQVGGEVGAVHDYLLTFNNVLNLNNEQIGFQILTRYRNYKGEVFSPGTINTNIIRFCEQIKQKQ